MRIHYLQHAPRASMGHIAQWAQDRGYPVTITLLGEKPVFPSLADVDLLILSGGPMSVYQKEKYPWLAEEVEFIRNAIDVHKHVLGICLGAQLVAESLGARVYAHVHKEVGWWPIRLTDEGKQARWLRGFPEEFWCFQHHGDTFDLPAGAVRLAAGAGCLNQAFQYGERVMGTQFHPEYQAEMIQFIAEVYGRNHGEGPFIQKPAEFLNQPEKLARSRELMRLLLTNIESAFLEGK